MIYRWTVDKLLPKPLSEWNSAILLKVFSSAYIEWKVFIYIFVSLIFVSEDPLDNKFPLVLLKLGAG